jgi:adenylosuccinate lyase
MKFDVYFMIRGQAGSTEVPNKHNPVEAESLEEVLKQLEENLPKSESLHLETIGIRITPVN